MKLTDKYKMSRWAYNQCRNGNDTPEMRSLINYWSWAYEYCYEIKDRPEVRKYIKNEIYLGVLEKRRNETNK